MWSSAEVGQAQGRLEALLYKRLKDDFGCVIWRFGHDVPLLTVTRPGAGTGAREVIDAFGARFDGTTSRVIERPRVNTRKELQRGLAEMKSSRPTRLIAVQLHSRDSELKCPQILVGVHRKMAERPEVRRWLSQVRREYPARLVTIRIGQLGLLL